MTILMKAKTVADELYEIIKTKVSELHEKGIQPHLATILVEGDPASLYYAQMKQKVAGNLGVKFTMYTLPVETKQQTLIDLIVELNKNSEVHGIMLELPLPNHISTQHVVTTISPIKDIDGVTPVNKLATMTGESGLYPATPQACIKLLKHYGYTLNGKNVTIVGRGQTVGLPLFHLLQREQATVTVCHSRTKDLAYHLSHADVAFVAIGRTNVVTTDMVHEKLVIIDAGINEINGGKIVGDVPLDVYEYVEAISPVPGGVGTLTTATLYENLIKAIALQTKEE